MSKEQTPIEKLIQFCWDNSIDEILKTPLKQKLNELLKEEQQYIQAKVLEALERLYDATQRTDFFVKYEGLEDWIEKELKQK